VIGAAIEVHRELGPGYLESLYEDALCIGLELRGVKHERQEPLVLTYKGRAVQGGRLDLLVEGRLVVELKTVEVLLPVHKAQVLSYLRALEEPLGLLLDFNVPYLRDGIQRVVLS